MCRLCLRACLAAPLPVGRIHRRVYREGIPTGELAGLGHITEECSAAQGSTAHTGANHMRSSVGIGQSRSVCNCYSCRLHSVHAMQVVRCLWHRLVVPLGKRRCHVQRRLVSAQSVLDRLYPGMRAANSGKGNPSLLVVFPAKRIVTTLYDTRLQGGAKSPPHLRELSL